MENTSKNIWNRIEAIHFIFIISIAIRLLVINRQIFFDEAFSYFMSKMPISFIFGGNDVHPPLYYLFLRPFSFLFGNNIELLRLSSIFLWCCFFWIAYQFISERFNTKTATYALFFMSLSPTLIYYSTELRMYMLLLMFAILNIAIYFYWIQSPSPKNTIYFIITALFLLNTHTFGALLLAVEGFYALFKKVRLKWLIFGFGGCALLFIPTFLLLFHVYTTYPSLNYAKIDYSSLISTYFFMFSPPSRYGFGYFLLIVGVAALLAYHKINPEIKKNAFYYICLAIPIFIFHVGKYTGIYHHRLFLIIAIPLYIILADLTFKIAQKTPNNSEHLAVIGSYLFLFIMLFSTTAFEQVFKTDTNKAMQQLDNSTIIIHDTTMTYLPFKMYLENTGKENYLSQKPEFTFCGSIVQPDEILNEKQIDTLLQEQQIMFLTLNIDETNSANGFSTTPRGVQN